MTPAALDQLVTVNSAPALLSILRAEHPRDDRCQHAARMLAAFLASPSRASERRAVQALRALPQRLHDAMSAAAAAAQPPGPERDERGRLRRGARLNPAGRRGVSSPESAQQQQAQQPPAEVSQQPVDHAAKHLRRDVEAERDYARHWLKRQCAEQNRSLASRVRTFRQIRDSGYALNAAEARKLRRIAESIEGRADAPPPLDWIDRPPKS